jgi:Uma2 family endonuclease
METTEKYITLHRYEDGSEELQDRSLVEEPQAVYINPSRRYTYADYLTWEDGRRRELIHGIVYDLFSAPMRIHAEISTKLVAWVNLFMERRKGKCKVFHAPFDVRFPKDGKTDDNEIDTTIQPDLCVVCDPKKLDERGCIGAPDLIVEVLSPSTRKKDLTTKFTLYEEAGVREYWVIDPPQKTLTVFLLQESGKFDEGTVYKKGKAPVAIFEGLKIDLKKLFEE